MRKQYWLLAALVLTATPVVAQIKWAEMGFVGEKPGLWQLTVTNLGVSPTVSTICTDTTTFDRLMYMVNLISVAAHCGVATVHRTGPVTTIDSKCDEYGHKVTTHTEVALESPIAFHERNTSHVTGRGNDMRASTSIEAKFLGQCSADMQIGDLKIPTGKTINLISP